ncbi:hypothetical protein AAC387_Pa08g1040 [Persea americana]
MKKGKGNPLIPFFSPICVIHLSSAATNISPAILLNCGVPSSSVVEGFVGLEKGQGQLLLGAGLVEEYQLDDTNEEPGDVIESATPLKVGQEREINASGLILKKKLLKSGRGWETPELCDEVTECTCVLRKDYIPNIKTPL